jgi:hypothetical protein
MIVNYVEGGWLIITQRAHGLLAAQLAYYWRKENRPKRWMETLIAIAEHDDATNELEDDDIVNENGGPVDFKMKKFEEQRCTKLMNLALSKSTYIALLTARHICFLYNKKEDKEASRFCKDLRNQEKDWLKRADVPVKEVDSVYKLLEWCDAFSLLICQQEIQPQSRKTEISNGPDGVIHQFYEKETGVLSVEPWPFEEDSFEVIIESRCLKQLVFKDSDEFRELYLKAEIIPQKYTLKRYPI